MLIDLVLHLDQHISDVAGRVYYNHAPQNPTYPCVTVGTLDGGERQHTNNAPDGIVDAEVIIAIYHVRYESCFSLAQEIRLLMDGFTGSLGETEVFHFNLIRDPEDYVTPVDGSNKGVWVISQEYDTRFVEQLNT